MSSQTMRAFPRAGVQESGRRNKIERQLSRYRPKLQPAIRALASRHERLAELSESFPALLAALAWPRAGVASTPIIAAVISGAPLASLARFAGVPLWLRRLPPELLIAPLPVLPDSSFFGHRIVNCLPRKPHHAAACFKGVSEAAKWSDEEFAIWCAAHFANKPRSRVRRRYRGGDNIHLLCLWS